MSTSRLILKNAADQLPSPDGVALAIMEIWDDENTSVPQMARLVETDPALSGRLLRLANAAANGARPVASIREAIARVGMRTVGQVAIAFSLVDQNLEGQCEAFDYTGFWSHSLLLATIARQLGAQSNIAPADDLFAAALLARIGRLALATVYPDEYDEILTSEPPSLIDEEQRRFGFNHNELSHELMRDYGVPEPLAQPAVRHETRPQPGALEDDRAFRIAILVHIACQLASHGLSESIKELAEAALGIDAGKLETRFAEGVAEWQEWSRVLSLPEYTIATPDPDVSPEQSTHDGTTAETAWEESHSSDKKALLLEAGTGGEIGAIIEASGFTTWRCETQEQLLRMAVQRHPDLLVIDYSTAGNETDKLCRLIRSTEWGKPLHIVAIGDTVETDEQTAFFRAGIDLYVERGMAAMTLQAQLTAAHRLADLRALWQADRSELKRTVNQLAVSRRKFETLSLTDELTGLPNRRAGMETLQQVWAKRERDGSTVGLLMLDIDHFKQVNDRYGHAAGDEILIQAASAWSTAIRDGDMLCRSGGEEFLVITTGTDIRGMVTLAERLQEATDSIALPWDEQVIRITASLGMACGEASDDMEMLLKTADKTLYIAKSKGRDRLCYRDNGQYRLTSRH